MPSPFICVCIAIIALILAVTLCHVDGAAALKCNSYRLESWLARHFRERQCTLEGRARFVDVQSSVHWEGCIV